MQYRPLGRSGLNVSEIGFGCWGIGGDAYGRTDDRTSIAAVHEALAQGINFFDTSDLYGGGKSEEVLGQALRGRRGEALIASKFGALGGLEKQDFSPAHQRRAIEGSLRRLGTDYLDLYQLHNPEPEILEKSPEVLAELLKLRAEGKIRAIGVSTRNPPDGLKLIEGFDFASVQVNFNLLDQRARACGFLDAARKKGVGVIARTPLCFGFLTGGYAKFDFPEFDHRRKWPEAQRKLWAEGLYKFLDGKRAAAGESPVQFALNFCLSSAGITTAIPGILTVEHARENASASGRAPLPAADLERCFEIYQSTSFFAPKAGG